MLCVIVRGTDRGSVIEFGNRAVETLSYLTDKRLTIEFCQWLDHHTARTGANLGILGSDYATDDLEQTDWGQDVSEKWWSRVRFAMQACSETMSGIEQNLYAVACAYYELGTAHMRCGHLGRADEMYHRALGIYEHLGCREEAALALVEMALLYSKAGYTDEADKCWKRTHVLLSCLDRTITLLMRDIDRHFPKGILRSDNGQVSK